MSLKARERKVALPVQQMRAEFAPSSFDKEKRTIDLVWSVGAKGLRGFYDPYYEELSMDPAHVRMARLESGATPFVDAHAAWSNQAVLGVVESAKIENGVGTARIRLVDPDTLENADAKDTIRKIESGILKNISVGYSVYRYDRQPSVEGEDYPTYLATDWEPTEISIVPVGFDSSAVVRNKEREAAPCVFVERAEEDKANKEGPTMTPEQIEEQKRQQEAAQKAAAEQARAAEKARQTEIRKIVSDVKLPTELADEAIKGDKTVDEVRAIVIEKLSAKTAENETRNAAASITAGVDASEKWRTGASNWLAQRAGVAGLIEKHTGQKLDGGEFRGLSLREIARESLERAGVNVRGMDVMKMVGLALTHRSGGMNTTSDFAVLLENTMHKVLLASYATTPDTWSRFAKKGTVSDFRAHPRYRQGTFGVLDSLNEHGEFKNKSIPDGRKESITAGTKGNIIALSRQAIVNDDMGAFSDLATRFGRAAKLSVEVDVYAALASNGGLGPIMGDGVTLFHANHKNIGTGAALAVSSIDADRVLMASQTDESGNEILDLRPAILVLPIGLGGAARVINQAQFDTEVSNKFQVPNKVVGLYRDIVDSPRITGTRRYSFADPSIAACLEVAFLDGQDMPFMENKEGFRVDGVEWKVRLDYGVAGVDYKGAVTNAGV
jgi:hypothetical protein